MTYHTIRETQDGKQTLPIVLAYSMKGSHATEFCG